MPQIPFQSICDSLSTGSKQNRLTLNWVFIQGSSLSSKTFPSFLSFSMSSLQDLLLQCQHRSIIRKDELILRQCPSSIPFPHDWTIMKKWWIGSNDGSATMNSGAKSQQSKSSNGSIINSGDGFNVLIIGDGHISLSLSKAMRQSRYVYFLSLPFDLIY